MTRVAPISIGGRRFAWGERTFVMGIVNVTPDSFSGDGLLAERLPGSVAEQPAGDQVSAAVEQARRMVADGADLLDVGGESTRPGHDPLDADEEMRRILPVIGAIHDALPGVTISVDTTKPSVATAALDAGASLINDVWGVRDDGAMVDLAAKRSVPIVLMHNRAEPRYDDVVVEVVDDLRRAVERAVDAGVKVEHVIVDPGIGFGKTADQNVELLGGLSALGRLGRPILLGTSRKSTIGRILDLPPDQRVEGTIATTALGVAAGVDIVRVHDVRGNVRAARVADAIIRGTWRTVTEEPPERREGGPR